VTAWVWFGRRIRRLSSIGAAALLVSCSGAGANQTSRLGDLTVAATPAASPVASGRSGPGTANGGRSSGSPARVAIRWVEGLTTHSYRDSNREMVARLRPYSTIGLIDSISVNSGAMALHRQQMLLRVRSEGEVVAVHSQDESTDDVVLIVIYKKSTVTTKGRDRELRATTLRLRHLGARWRVAEVLSI
jgi:hypothetical protein